MLYSFGSDAWSGVRIAEDMIRLAAQDEWSSFRGCHGIPIDQRQTPQRCTDGYPSGKVRLAKRQIHCWPNHSRHSIACRQIRTAFTLERKIVISLSLAEKIHETGQKPFDPFGERLLSDNNFGHRQVCRLVVVGDQSLVHAVVSNVSGRFPLTELSIIAKPVLCHHGRAT